MTARAVAVVTAAPDEHDAVADLLAEAFRDDPLIHAVTVHASSPSDARRRLFRTILSTTLRQGGTVLVVRRGSVLKGAAVVLDPAAPGLGAWLKRVRAGIAFLRLLPMVGRAQLRLLNAADRASRRHSPSTPHHALVAVGVTRDARGFGIGRALVEATVDRAHAHPTSHGVRLETESADNAERYARWGFALLARVVVEPVTVYVMSRPTRPVEKVDA